MDIIDRLEQRAREHPDRLLYRYLIDGETRAETLTYGDFFKEVQTLAQKLHSQTKPGQTVLLLYLPGLPFMIAFMACLYAGLVPVPTYPPLPRRLESELKRIELLCRDSTPALLLLDQMTSRLLKLSFLKEKGIAFLKALVFLKSDHFTFATIPQIVTENVRGDNSLKQRIPNPNGIAFIQYSSGSTNLPKGVMVTHTSLIDNVRQVQNHLGIHPGSTLVSWLPHYHDMGLIGILLSTIETGAQATFMSPKAFIEKPVRWLKALSTYRGTHTASPNFGFELAVRDLKRKGEISLDLSSLEVALCGAEPINPATPGHFYNALRPYGLQEGVFFPAYGLAENTLIASCGPKLRPPIIKSFDSEKLQNLEIEESAEGTLLVSCGQAVQNHTVAIVDPDSGVRQTEEKGGEIWIKGLSVTGGYWGKPELTESSFQAFTTEGEGPFLRTGDMGFIHKGELYIFGRIKDIIIVHGKKYAPQDIEFAVQNAHEAIRKGNVAAFSVPGLSTEQLVIVAEIKDTYPDEENPHILKAILHATTSNFQLPLREIVLIKPRTICKTTSGKIQRHGVKNLYLSHQLPVVASWLSPRHK